jgi:glutathione synthase
MGPLDALDPPARAAADAALADGARWVLKPQREGGGNNLYGVELSQFLAVHR